MTELHNTAVVGFLLAVFFGVLLAAYKRRWNHFGMWISGLCVLVLSGMATRIEAPIEASQIVRERQAEDSRDIHERVLQLVSSEARRLKDAGHSGATKRTH